MTRSYISVKYEPENPIITTATVGTKTLFTAPHFGKAILAYSEEEEGLALYGADPFSGHLQNVPSG